MDKSMDGIYTSLHEFISHCRDNNICLRYWTKSMLEEDCTCLFGYVALFVPLGKSDCLIGFSETGDDSYIDMYRLSEITIAYAKSDQEEDDD